MKRIFAEDIALFGGKAFHNLNLLKADKGGVGSVTTEILLQEDSNSFTLSNEWGFPRSINFNGESCRIPLPEFFPMLPNSSLNRKPSNFQFLLIFSFYLVLNHLPLL